MTRTMEGTAKKIGYARIANQQPDKSKQVFYHGEKSIIFHDGHSEAHEEYAARLKAEANASDQEAVKKAQEVSPTFLEFCELEDGRAQQPQPSRLGERAKRAVKTDSALVAPESQVKSPLAQHERKHQNAPLQAKVQTLTEQLQEAQTQLKDAQFQLQNKEAIADNLQKRYDLLKEKFKQKANDHNELMHSYRQIQNHQLETMHHTADLQDLEQLNQAKAIALISMNNDRKTLVQTHAQQNAAHVQALAEKDRLIAQLRRQVHGLKSNAGREGISGRERTSRSPTRSRRHSSPRRSPVREGTSIVPASPKPAVSRPNSPPRTSSSKKRPTTRGASPANSRVQAMDSLILASAASPKTPPSHGSATKSLSSSQKTKIRQSASKSDTPGRKRELGSLATVKRFNGFDKSQSGPRSSRKKRLASSMLEQGSMRLAKKKKKGRIVILNSDSEGGEE